MSLAKTWVLLSVLFATLALPLVAAGAPTVTAATAEPAVAQPGVTVKFACTLADPENLVKRVIGVVREVSYMSAPFTQEGAAWVFVLPIPKGVPAGTYHIDLQLLGADGKAIKPAAGPTSIALTIPGEAEEAEPPAPQAPDPAPELATVEVTGDAGAFVLRSPYRNYAGWYKGQLHCHTTNSDGKCTPDQLEAKYRQAGCDWLAITDHETITPDPQAEGGHDVGAFITALEHGTPEGHTNVIGITRKVSGAAQEAINRTVAAGGLLMLNHPDWVACYDLREMDRLSGYQLIEIMNGGCLDDGQQDGTRAWDYVLAKGKMVWGVATDDFHGGPAAEVGKGLVVVNAPELTAEAIFTNLKNGNFYSTQGPELTLTLEEGVLTVKSPGNVSVFFRGPYGLAYQVDELEPAKGKDAASYRFLGDERYVRVEVYDKQTGKRAWSQPIFVDKK